VGLDFDAVFATEAVRRLEIQANTVIQDLVIGIEKATELDLAGSYFTGADSFANGQGIGPGEAQNADTPGTWRRGYRGDGVMRGHGVNCALTPVLLARGFDTFGDNPLLCYRQHVIDDPV
jgi:hypothetical protein